MTTARSLAEPLEGRSRIPFNTITMEVAQPEVVLCTQHPCLRGYFIPMQCSL